LRFWDTSALLPLFVSEAGTRRAERWMASDPVVVVWTLARVEMLSALARRRREEPGSAPVLATARRLMLGAWNEWSEVTAMEAVCRHAERLVESHPLRAADALHLGAALVAADGVPASLGFVTFDERQAAAAEREGFQLLGP